MSDKVTDADREYCPTIAGSLLWMYETGANGQKMPVCLNIDVIAACGFQAKTSMFTATLITGRRHVLSEHRFSPAGIEYVTAMLLKDWPKKPTDKPKKAPGPIPGLKEVKEKGEKIEQGLEWMKNELVLIRKEYDNELTRMRTQYNNETSSLRTEMENVRKEIDVTKKAPQRKRKHSLINTDTDDTATFDEEDEDPAPLARKRPAAADAPIFPLAGRPVLSPAHPTRPKNGQLL